jgi:CRISP-associated protein Cas1
MIGRIIEVAHDQRHLHAHRGFLVVQEAAGDRMALGRVPLDDIAALIANAHGLSYTNNLLVALSERGAPFVLCAANHNAVGMLLPIDGNFEQGKRFDAQIAAAQPTHKRLWASVVKSKLQQQAAVLDAVGSPTAPLLALVGKVRSGDPQNIEAQGARRYWQLLFGSGFRRDQNELGINSLLNYGYTVMRSAMARAIVAAGLHPSIGLHHSNAGNAMRLVDDLMEPFRPLIDIRVWQLKKEGSEEVTALAKRTLVHTLFDDMQTVHGTAPVSVCMQRLAVSLARVYMGEAKKLDLPNAQVPTALATDLAAA